MASKKAPRAPKGVVRQPEPLKVDRATFAMVTGLALPTKLAPSVNRLQSASTRFTQLANELSTHARRAAMALQDHNAEEALPRIELVEEAAEALARLLAGVAGREATAHRLQVLDWLGTIGAYLLDATAGPAVAMERLYEVLNDESEPFPKLRHRFRNLYYEHQDQVEDAARRWVTRPRSGNKAKSVPRGSHFAPVTKLLVMLFGRDAVPPNWHREARRGSRKKRV